jgi:hypothetical protein
MLLAPSPAGVGLGAVVGVAVGVITGFLVGKRGKKQVPTAVNAVEKSEVPPR